jgi:alpha-tubulin suppressor-like RCC1 family protein
MIHIEEDEEEGDDWGIKDILFSSSNENKNLYDFNPYYNARSPFILTIEMTQKGMFILLRNGLIIKLSNEQRKIESIYSNSKLNNMISIGTKIVDISCGIQHILARGRDCRIYSWGINSYGQLGLEKLGLNAEIVKPTEVELLSDKKINQIYAFEYTSFCVDSMNDVYGFGKVK